MGHAPQRSPGTLQSSPSPQLNLHSARVCRKPGGHVQPLYRTRPDTRLPLLLRLDARLDKALTVYQDCGQQKLLMW